MDEQTNDREWWTERGEPTVPGRRPRRPRRESSAKEIAQALALSVAIVCAVAILRPGLDGRTAVKEVCGSQSVATFESAAWGMKVECGPARSAVGGTGQGPGKRGSSGGSIEAESNEDTGN